MLLMGKSTINVSEYVSDRISVGGDHSKKEKKSQPHRILQLRNHSP